VVVVVHRVGVVDAAMLPNLGRLSLRCASESTSAPPMTATAGPRAHESSTSGDAPAPKPRSKKQKADPNEPSAEEKQAAYAAQHAKADHDARIDAAREALEKARDEQMDMVSEFMGQMPDDKEDEYNALVAKVNRLEAELEALREAPAPAEVEPELMPGQTAARKRIQNLQWKQSNEGLTPEEQAELEGQRVALRKQRVNAAKEVQEARLLALAAAKVENRRKALDDPKNWKRHLNGGQSGEPPKYALTWWLGIGQHMAAQRVERAFEARVDALAAETGSGPPPAPPPARRRIAWPLGSTVPRDVVNNLNKQLEQMGLLEAQAEQAAYQAREARLGPVREERKRLDEAAEKAAKEAAAQAAKDAKEKKAGKRAKDQAAQAASQAGAVAQDEKEKKARRLELARKDKEAHAAHVARQA